MVVQIILFTGTSQLLSVPYALYAENTKNSGKSKIYLRDGITDQEAKDLLNKFLGPNTEYVYIINTTVLTNVDLSSATSLMVLDVYNNSSLVSITGNAIETVYDQFSIHRNPSLTNISFTSLSNSDGVYITDNAKLNQILIPNLKEVQTSLSISYNKSLKSIDASSFIKGDVEISVTEAMTSINLPNYTHGYILISQNTALSSINLSKFIIGRVVIDGSPLLLNANFNNYNEGYLEVSSCNSLQQINLPKFVSGNLNIHDNKLLNSVTFPSLTSFQFNEFYLIKNNLSSNTINSILNKMLTVLPASGKTINLSGQTPAAPPTGQGITDKQTLIITNNNIQTD